MGIMQFNKQNNERAKDELKHILKLLNDYLLTRTYLVGERITLADIAVSSDLLLLFQWVNRFVRTWILFLCIHLDYRTKSTRTISKCNSLVFNIDSSKRISSCSW